MYSLLFNVYLTLVNEFIKYLKGLQYTGFTYSMCTYIESFGDFWLEAFISEAFCKPF